MSLLALSGTNSVSGGYDIDNSCKFEADNVEKMTHTYDSAPTSQKKGTISMWFKRTEVGSNIGLFQFGDDASGNYLSLRWGRDIYGSLETYGMRIGGTNFSVGNTYGAIRDTSAWYHVVIAIDTTQATSTNRFRVYRNGVEPGWSTDNTSNITQNADLAIGENGKDIMIGEGVYRYNGYIAEVHYVDGQQLTSADFGEYDDDSGIWKPKAYTGTYGNNGFYLDFKNASNLGEDQSGNNHDFTLSNISSADQATDTPTNNFATLNPLQATSYYTLKEGGTVLEPSQSGWGTGVSSIGVTSGKWYFEERSTATDRSTMYGVVNESDVLDLQGDKHVGDGVYSVGFYGNSAQVFSNGSVIATYNIFNQNQLVACALDLDNGKVYFAIQNTWQNSADPANGTGGISLPTGGSDTYFFGVNGYFSDNDVKTNHGGYTIQTPDSAASDENGYGTFEYAPPSGYLAICTKNLAENGG